MSRSIALKICGMRDPENILEVAALYPDYMGFIFYPESPRYVGPNFQIPHGFPDQVKRVGVFVNETPQQIVTIAGRCGIGFVQLHGNESPQECKVLQQAGLKVIKAIPMGILSDIGRAGEFEGAADYLLFDTPGPALGGSGKSFDWNLLSNYRGSLPFFLGGGLSAANILSARRQAGRLLHALDVNSKVELSPGAKDLVKVKHVFDVLNSNDAT